MEAPAEDVNLLDTLDEDARIDVARMLGDLFEWDDEDDEEHDIEDGIYREQRAKTGEEESALEMKAKIEPEDQARYNKFMDTFYRRVNADARSSFDPLETAVMSRKAKKAKKEGKKKSDVNKKTPKKKPKSKKKSKKNSRQGKDLSLEEEEDKTEAEVPIAEEEVHHIVARAAEEVEEIEDDEDEDEALERQERSAVPVEENSDVATARKGKPKGGKKGKKEKSGKNKGGKKKGGKKKKAGNKKKSNKKTKRSANKKDSKKGGKSTKGSKKATRSGPQTSKASVSGVSTLTRDGDVSVVDKKDGKELRSDFKLGPVNLKVNRKFGTGKKAIVRTATATAPELTGKMHLYVSSKGRTKITKFNIARPAVVHTDGSLNKDLQRSGNNNFMENSISRIVPVAAKKLKLAARAVLEATESKN